MKLKKGSAEAKAYMAKIRAKKGKKTPGKKVGNTLNGKNPYTFDVKALRSNGVNVMQTRSIYAKNISQAKTNLKTFLEDKLGYEKIVISNGREGHEGITKLDYLGAKKPTKKVGNTLKFEDGYFKVLGKKNGQLVEITENPLNYIDAKKFIKEQGIEKYYTNVDIVPYRGNKKPVKYIGSTLKLHKKEIRLGMPPKTTTKSGNGYHKDTKSHNVRISVISGINKVEYDFRDSLENEIKDYLETIERLKKQLPNVTNKLEKSRYTQQINLFKSMVLEFKRKLKKQNNIINKNLR